ncbi:TetR/AcrR family transcriptional regulator [Sporosarcina sp. HYO08]|uniref:TetR/AcrR family transcriptional regulator n=1 Tax=Sporosarcina sp. HYO08 TaxID=1759557 RepID=UPI000794CE3D|nr:TetR/AcrR family transcriptional regulator [Sporosarcina sp. HYO08]KXH83870.1 hypothetical protein AU377_03690 [Sporosarcina sp. HYO08]
MNERKRQVLRTAQRIFIDKGFTATSVQDILNEAKISKGTFYNYFSSKNECLLAILEQARIETYLKRQELLIGQDPRNKEILTQQIVLRLHMNREQNLLPIYEAVYHSGEEDLKQFVKKILYDEFSWLAERIVDVYGKSAKPYALDCAMMLLGMLHHTLHSWSTISSKEPDATQLLNFLLRRMDSILPDMIRSSDAFFDVHLFKTFRNDHSQNTITKDLLAKDLLGFRDRLELEEQPAGKQYVQFLLEEIQSNSPRFFVLESIARSFRESYVGTSHEAEARELASKVWRFSGTYK